MILVVLVEAVVHGLPQSGDHNDVIMKYVKLNPTMLTMVKEKIIGAVDSFVTFEHPPECALKVWPRWY